MSLQTMSRHSVLSGLARLKLIAAAAVLIAVSYGSMQIARAAGPFAGLSGSWRGGGIITLRGGTRERIRCRARYAVGGRGSILRQELRCASDSYNFVLASNVVYSRGRISGQWSESTNGVGGTVVGVARGGSISARIEGGGFTASVSLSTRGNRQRVTIYSPGSKLEHASISLRRRSRR